MCCLIVPGSKANANSYLNYTGYYSLCEKQKSRVWLLQVTNTAIAVTADKVQLGSIVACFPSESLLFAFN